MEYGLIGLVILALDIWAVLSVWGSGASTGAKVAWTIGIIIFPVVGLVVWFLAGPRGSKTAVL
ncbi:PLD nuclease N-terminal domain-containing protein [Sphingosinicella sp.]|jgi:hypothetical protein|uniref:PLD nuclease N-terminal domain-containing protein n=1 Tax=Sphingosinicella sp. TaxID=1917971 RepID=UPI0018479508|nr:PLD nuclease N-terminal domain-containing protein [Sphingosinicella sp.]MBA4758955.1 PLDc_N domain-containing protein [Sphingosinicella sp.]MEA3539591.1 PLD nuclease N-terminal domain-containing protein [Pseudomonadota bacterium]